MADRCHYHVTTLGQCELDEGHHGPCTVGRAQAWQMPTPCERVAFVGYSHFMVPRSCEDCDRIDAQEVLRLHNGGALRPLQHRPPWLALDPASRRRANIVKWAERIAALAALLLASCASSPPQPAPRHAPGLCGHCDELPDKCRDMSDECEVCDE